MKCLKTEIEGVYILEPDVFTDNRGYFMETFNKKKFQEETGITTEFVQDNESRSAFGVLRGLHLQKPPFAQAKLVRVVKGRVKDVAVDLRRGSSTFGQHIAVELSEDNKRQLFIPRGFAHGFIVLSKEAVLQYKCDNYYDPDSEMSLAWNSAELKIDWELPVEDIIISAKDKENSVFEKDNFFLNTSKSEFDRF